jgi:hypothetical protein
MRYFTFLFFSILLFSCNKGTLDPTDLKRVVLFKVDFETYDFQGGKEFAYFENDTSTVKLPTSAFYTTPSATDGRLTIKYTEDTIFDGFVSQNGIGEVEFPQNIDNQIHFFRNKDRMDKPLDSKFEILFNDSADPLVPLDSIWHSISQLTKLQDYQVKNPTANIGIFLYRPSQDPANKKTWKWYVILKN